MSYSDTMIPYKQLKAYAKVKGFDKSFDPHKTAYGSLPSHAATNPEIKQLYINGHKSDSPEEDKSVHDARLRIPTLLDFFHKHPVIHPKTFLGDATFCPATK